MGFRIIVVGTEGTVAKQFLSLAEEQSWDVDLVGGEDFTACGSTWVEDFERRMPSAILNLCSDVPDVFEGESLRRLERLQDLVEAAVKSDVPIIQLSSYAFFGTAMHAGALSEGDVDQALPLRSEVEQCVSRVPRHVILRHSWLLDGGTCGLLPLFVPALIESRDIYVSDHDYGGPVTSVFLAGVVLAVVQQILAGAENWGVFHLRSADTCSEAEFCDHLVRQLHKELDSEVTFPRVSSVDDDRRFLRGSANLQGRRITDCFGIQLPTWRRGFGRVLRDWLAEGGG